jgi:hypothetical protein
MVDSWVEAYRHLPTEDLTCQFTSDGVTQWASGGGDCRRAKEVMRKAFAILVLEDCFKQGFTVQLCID